MFAHCVQHCFRTHGGRILHDDLCLQVSGFYNRRDSTSMRNYICVLDHCRQETAKGDEAVVVDAQVVSSETALNVSHEWKVEKYRCCENLMDHMAKHTGMPRNNVRFIANGKTVTITWRSIWSSQSETEMHGLGLTSDQLRNLTTRVLWGWWMNWRRFNRITIRYEMWRHRTADNGAGWCGGWMLPRRQNNSSTNECMYDKRELLISSQLALSRA